MDFYALCDRIRYLEHDLFRFCRFNITELSFKVFLLYDLTFRVGLMLFGDTDASGIQHELLLPEFAGIVIVCRPSYKGLQYYLAHDDQNY